MTLLVFKISYYITDDYCFCDLIGTVGTGFYAISPPIFRALSSKHIAGFMQLTGFIILHCTLNLKFNLNSHLLLYVKTSVFSLGPQPMAISTYSSLLTGMV